MEQRVIRVKFILPAAVPLSKLDSSRFMYCLSDCRHTSDLVPIINPRRPCAVRVTVLGLCVCVSVYAYSCNTGNEAAYEGYQQHQCNKRSKNKMAILLKRRRSRTRN